MSHDGAPGAPALAWSAIPQPAEIEELVRSLVAVMHGGGISELDVAFGPVTIRLRGQATAPGPRPVAPVPAEPPPVEPPRPSDHVITAPMIGTFYDAPSPGAPPFVQVGDTIEVGQVVGVIEAMKIMNEITADQAGTVSRVLVANAQPVEYGSPLILLSPTRDGRP